MYKNRKIEKKKAKKLTKAELHELFINGIKKDADKHKNLLWQLYSTSSKWLKEFKWQEIDKEAFELLDVENEIIYIEEERSDLIELAISEFYKLNEKIGELKWQTKKSHPMKLHTPTQRKKLMKKNTRQKF